MEKKLLVKGDGVQTEEKSEALRQSCAEEERLRALGFISARSSARVLSSMSVPEGDGKDARVLLGVRFHTSVVQPRGGDSSPTNVAVFTPALSNIWHREIRPTVEKSPRFLVLELLSNGLSGMEIKKKPS